MSIYELLKTYHKALKRDHDSGTYYAAIWRENQRNGLNLWGLKIATYCLIVYSRIRRHMRQLFAAVGINGTSGAEKAC